MGGPEAPGAVRIIGGRWKRTPLPVADIAGLRPTPDRVRKTLFDWLSHRFDQSFAGRTFVDLFAGTGALGLEACSRGAERVLLIERDRAAARRLRATIERLGASDRVSMREGDAVAAAAALVDGGQRFDVVFLDPPFGTDLLDRMLPLAARLATDAIYVETSARLDRDRVQSLGLTMLRAGRAGQVHYHLLTTHQRDEETDDADRDLSGNVRSADTRS